MAVLGLDNRPQAKPHFRFRRRSRLTNSLEPAAADVSYTPVQVAQLYQFPAGATATGQTIGIIELGGGYRTADITAYFKTLGLTAPSVTAVSVDGGKNAPTQRLQRRRRSHARHRSRRQPSHPAPRSSSTSPPTPTRASSTPSPPPSTTPPTTPASSPSVGAARSPTGPPQAMTALDAACQSAAALGITITVAAGDNGSTDGVTGNNVDFPASSPHVLGLRRHQARRQRLHHHLRGGLERAGQQRRRHRRRRQQRLPSAHLAG